MSSSFFTHFAMVRIFVWITQIVLARHCRLGVRHPVTPFYPNHMAKSFCSNCVWGRKLWSLSPYIITSCLRTFCQMKGISKDSLVSCSRSRAIQSTLLYSLCLGMGLDTSRCSWCVSYLSFLLICDLELSREESASHSYNVVTIVKNKRCWKHIHKSNTTHPEDSYLSDDNYNS